jgi:tetraprenyl-beta-curcumene synthase
MRTPAKAAGGLATGAVFARAAHTYWTDVFPKVARELAGWRERAGKIGDPALRTQALQSLAKRGNMEGAAAFATFAPDARRAAVVRATVAFQTAYNHLDTLSERPHSGGSEENRRLHEPLLAAMRCAQTPGGAGPAERPGQRQSRAPGHDEARPIHPPKDAEDYVAALVQSCRTALSELPSYPAVAPAAVRAAERVVCFQTYNRHERGPLERWGREQTPAASELRWWETAASGGSSLGVHVMIAAAAEPGIDQEHVQALERAYFPWIGALHSMLDHLIDVEEDARNAQPNLVELYGSPAEAAQRMALLARRALERARDLRPAHRHELIVAAMAGFYLSAPQAQVGEAAVAKRAVLDVFGALARPGLAIFKARRAVERMGRMTVRTDTLAARASTRAHLPRRGPVRAS